jgi:hypothetical protein
VTGRAVPVSFGPGGDVRREHAAMAAHTLRRRLGALVRIVAGATVAPSVHAPRLDAGRPGGDVRERSGPFGGVWDRGRIISCKTVTRDAIPIPQIHVHRQVAMTALTRRVECSAVHRATVTSLATDVGAHVDSMAAGLQLPPPAAGITLVTLAARGPAHGAMNGWRLDSLQLGPRHVQSLLFGHVVTALAGELFVAFEVLVAIGVAAGARGALGSDALLRGGRPHEESDGASDDDDGSHSQEETTPAPAVARRAHDFRLRIVKVNATPMRTATPARTQ